MTTTTLDWIETERTRLRPFEGSDAEACCSWFIDPDVMQFIPGGRDATLDEVQRRIKGYCKHQEKHVLKRFHTDSRRAQRQCRAQNDRRRDGKSTRHSEPGPRSETHKDLQSTPDKCPTADVLEITQGELEAQREEQQDDAELRHVVVGGEDQAGHDQ